MTERILDVDCTVVRGHFLALDEAARRSGMGQHALRRAPGVVMVAGLDGHRPTFPEFQFSDHGFVDGLREIVESLDGMLDGLALAAWLQASQPRLGGTSIVDWLGAGRPQDVLDALTAAVRRSAESRAA